MQSKAYEIREAPEQKHRESFEERWIGTVEDKRTGPLEIRAEDPEPALRVHLDNNSVR